MTGINNKGTPPDQLLLALNQNPISRAVLEKCIREKEKINPEPGLILLEISEFLVSKKKYREDEELINNIAGLLFLYFKDRANVVPIDTDPEGLIKPLKVVKH